METRKTCPCRPKQKAFVCLFVHASVPTCNSEVSPAGSHSSQMAFASSLSHAPVFGVQLVINFYLEPACQPFISNKTSDVNTAVMWNTVFFLMLRSTGERETLQ